MTRRVVAAEAGRADPLEPAIEPPAMLASDAVVDLFVRAELRPIETLVFRILLAAELDRNTYRCMQRLASDPTLPGIAIDAMVTVVEAIGGDPVAALLSLRPDGRLLERGLIDLLGDARSPALVRRLTMPAHVVDFAVTSAPPAPLRAPLVRVEPVVDVDTLCPIPVRGDPDHGSLVDHLRGELPDVIHGNTLWICGPAGIGRKTAVAGVLATLGYRLITLAFGEAVRLPMNKLVATAWREVLLRRAVLCIHNVENPREAVAAEVGESAMAATPPDESIALVYGWLKRAGVPTVFTSDLPPSSGDFEAPPHVIRLEAPTKQDTLALWRACLPGTEGLESMATQFRITPGRVVQATDEARRIAGAMGRTIVDQRDLLQAVSGAVAQQVSILGTLIEDSQRWEDIVLPKDTLDSVRELIARVRHRHQVLDQWGFRRKMSKGLGLAALFAGPPGTGKTMVASLIARELGQELYQIDLSRVVSKWIGETEKNLARVFDAADGANVLLLFDEADSLFSKRTEVKSSNDRHSNSEINYLLQRVERFEGVCILTTNLEGSIDPAFKRRLAFRLNFQIPEEEERAELWRRMMPTSADLATGVDFRKLAHEYEFAGGNIRNAVLRAAFLAASEGRAIDQEILERAVRLEYRDAGKLAAVGRIN
ncbi:MAG: ATP-binding protein [Proteobacteria bacterium]|nr:ATP-binding protein [Pseudomonadota bacterium]